MSDDDGASKRPESAQERDTRLAHALRALSEAKLPIDSPAFRELYGLYKDHVETIAHAITQGVNRRVREDACQHVWQRVCEGKFNGRARFTTWAYTVLRNYFVDHDRKKRAVTIGNQAIQNRLGSTAGGNDHSATDRDLKEKMLEALQALPDPHRTVARLRLSNYSHREIGIVIGQTPETSRQLFKSACRMLQGCRSEIGDSPKAPADRRSS